jgi:hypothetical protein
VTFGDSAQHQDPGLRREPVAIFRKTSAKIVGYLCAMLAAKLHGHYSDYGLTGNGAALAAWR